MRSHGRWLYQLPCKQQKKNKREFRDLTQRQRVGHTFFKSNFDLGPVVTDPPSTVAASAAQAAASAATQAAESAAPPSFFFHLDFDDRNQPQIDVAAYAAYDANSKFGHSNLCISWFQKNMTDFRTLAVEGFGSKCHNLELCSSDIDTVVVLVPGQNITKWLNQLQIRHEQAHPTSFEPTPYAVFDIGRHIELGV